MAQCMSPFLEIEVVNAAYLLDCNFMPSCKPISLVEHGLMQLCIERLALDGYGYTRGYGSGRVVILAVPLPGSGTGRIAKLLYPQTPSMCMVTVVAIDSIVQKLPRVRGASYTGTGYRLFNKLEEQHNNYYAKWLSAEKRSLFR